MKIKTSELTRTALDWAVTMAENWAGADFEVKPYSTDWAQGGPIIDREDIAISSAPDGLWAAYASKGTRLVQHGGQAVEVFNWTYKQQGYTPLIAAMRCYVASKLGDEVDLPKKGSRK
jgi:hypothetical protein